MRLASEWFMEARQAEKKGDVRNAVLWYEAALGHAPGNYKISSALARVKALQK